MPSLWTTTSYRNGLRKFPCQLTTENFAKFRRRHLRRLFPVKPRPINFSEKGHFIGGFLETFENHLFLLLKCITYKTRHIQISRNLQNMFLFQDIFCQKFPAHLHTQQAFTCSKSTMETPEQCVKHVQS